MRPSLSHSGTFYGPGSILRAGNFRNSSHFPKVFRRFRNACRYLSSSVFSESRMKMHSSIASFLLDSRGLPYSVARRPVIVTIRWPDADPAVLRFKCSTDTFAESVRVISIELPGWRNRKSALPEFPLDPIEGNCRWLRPQQTGSRRCILRDILAPACASLRRRALLHTHLQENSCMPNSLYSSR